MTTSGGPPGGNAATSTAFDKPRKADDRVGYFTTSFLDLGKYKMGETKVRYINRWHLEKADPALKVSPPKNPRSGCRPIPSSVPRNSVIGVHASLSTALGDQEG